MTKIKLLVIIMMILEARLSEGVTAKELFPDKLNGMMLNGVWVRKGTIAATIKNIERFNFKRQRIDLCFEQSMRIAAA